MPIHDYPYKNLVFEGGGVKGVAYGGVFEVLEQNKITPQIEPTLISGGNFRRRHDCDHDEPQLTLPRSSSSYVALNLEFDFHMYPGSQSLAWA